MTPSEVQWTVFFIAYNHDIYLLWDGPLDGYCFVVLVHLFGVS